VTKFIFKKIKKEKEKGNYWGRIWFDHSLYYFLVWRWLNHPSKASLGVIKSFKGVTQITSFFFVLILFFLVTIRAVHFKQIAQIKCLASDAIP